MSLRWEDAAVREERTVTGWWCVKCGNMWDGERAARFCCSAERPCEQCGARHETRGYCRPCADARSLKQFEKLEPVEESSITGSYMVCHHDDDHYFTELDYYLEWCLDKGVEPMPVVAEPVEPPLFKLRDFLADHLPEACDTDDVDDQINAIIRKATPQTFYPGGRRLIVPANWREPFERGEAQEVKP